MKTKTTNGTAAMTAEWQQRAREATAAEAAHRETKEKNGHRRYLVEGDLTITDACAEAVRIELTAEVARAAEEAARVVATRAVDADEVAAGDDLALACDPERLHADQVEAMNEERRLTLALTEARNRRLARLQRAIDASSELRARRSAAGLPPPRGFAWPVGGPFESNFDQLLKAISDAPPMGMMSTGRPRSERIRALRHFHTKVCAALEQKRRDEEKAKAEREQWAKDHADAQARDAERKQRERETTAAEREKEARAEEELAAAYRARVGQVQP